MVDKDILDFVQSSKNIIDVDSDDQNEMNNATPFPISSEMRNAMKSMRSYFDVHSNGEINIKMDDMELFDKKNNAVYLSLYIRRICCLFVCSLITQDPDKHIT
ncbi:hypothetical protein TNCV_2680991 [Trichonephila clavipes]|uniref:Uncharacterized protein n=1 Tax=Trichonephila clavipes TaxID=2585209 RepID=A0A8X6V661_TRICX|nr:hypothetical protein TNCV_2680991 [Trichonephila clavipes]